VAATLFATFGTIGFVSLFAGAVGDRLDRRRVMIASDLAGAAAFGVMALLEDPGALLFVAFLSALAEAPFLSASTAAIPNLVPERDVAWANGTIAVGRNAGILVGPLIGGVLVASVGAGAVFAVNAVSFVVSALLVMTVAGRFAGDRADTTEHLGTLAGLRFVVRDRVLRASALAWLAIQLGQGMTQVADVPLVALFGVGAAGYGLLVACWGGGSVVGSLGARRLTSATEPVAMLLGALAVAVTAVVVGVSPWWWLVLAMLVVMGAGEGVTLVAQSGVVQRRTPDPVRSRVVGAIEAVSFLGLALSYVVAGPIVEWLGPRGTYVVGGAIGLVAVAILLPVLGEARASVVAIEAETD
jgi:MFS family permease